MALTKVTGQVIKNTTDVTVGVLTVTNTLAVGGTVSIGGTLTYEDVTNVDAVGLITARNGIVVGSGITLSKDGDGFFTGVTTATTFVGNLTGTASQVTISNGADNRVLTAASANTLNGEANLKFDGTNLDIDSDSGHLRIGDDQDLDLYHNGSNGYLKNSTGQQLYRSGTHTFENAAGSTEYLRIDSSGRLMLGTTTEGQSSADDLTIATSANTGITIRSGTSNTGNLYFSDGTSSTDEFQGFIEYDHSGSFLRFGTAATERLRIYANGAVLIGADSGEAGGDAKLAIDCQGLDIYDGVGDASNYGLIFANDPTGNKANGIGFFNDSASTCGGYIVHQDKGGGNIGDLVFATAASSDTPVERFRITSAGLVGINNSSPAYTLSVVGDSGGNFAASSNSTNGVLSIVGKNSSGSVSAISRIKSYPDGSSNQSHMAFETRNSSNSMVEAFRVDSAQRLLIGDDGSTGAALLQVQKSSGDMVLVRNHETNYESLILSLASGTADIYASSGGSTSRPALRFLTNDTERYRIHSNGKQSWNNTTFPYGETFHFYNGNEGSCASFYQNSSNDHTNLILRHGRGLSGYSGYQMLFKRNDNTNVGSITSGASSTSFNTSSDYRLKENQIAIPNAIDKLNKLKPYEFNFKDDPDYKYLGFFAHEVQEIIPNGVACGEKDEVYTEDSPSEADDYKKGDMKIQSLDYGKLTPLLTAALQEAIVEIESLKAEVAALKSS